MTVHNRPTDEAVPIAAKLRDHPTVRAVRATLSKRRPPPQLDADWLRETCKALGADDVGFVDIDRPELDVDRDDVLSVLPGARTLVAFVVAMNADAIRSPARSLANLEFHRSGDRNNEVAAAIAERLRAAGARAVHPAMGFPMEMDRFPDKIWVVSHKLVAQAAGLGRMGIHRNVIHPKLGNFILLGTVITDAVVGEQGRPIDYQPCLDCKLCVSACPPGAIGADGHFDFSACYAHNYREFMGGFTDWVGEVADARDRSDYRRRVADTETVSMWQSLSFGANYKAAYCMAVCPAGEDVIGPFLQERGRFVKEVVRPLRDKEEPVYVLRNSDAREHVEKRFPNKRVRPIRNATAPRSVEGFLRALPLFFQRGRARDVQLRMHFTFTGSESGEATVVIDRGELAVRRGHEGEADVHVRADAEAWLDYLGGRRGLLPAVLRGRVRVRGPLRHVKTFQSCIAD